MKHQILLWWRRGKTIVISFIGIGLCIGLVGFAQYQTPKGLWDWMQLLIVPIVLAFGGFWLNRTTSRTEQEIARERYVQDQEIAKDKQREDLLQTYLDHMSELLLKEGLRKSLPDSEVRNVARVRTLTVLSQLDTMRKNHLFSFLREARLVTARQGESIVSLSQAHMQGIDLKKVHAMGIDLSKTDLREADLSVANFSLANLISSDLSRADLSYADFRLANLSDAIFLDANLTGAGFDKANLRRASLLSIKATGSFFLKPTLKGRISANQI